MKRSEKAFSIMGFIALGLVTSLLARQNNNHEAEMLLQEAQHFAAVEGDLEQAIALCQKIVASPNGNRTIVAKALLQMGQFYEKLGRDEARKAFERVVNEFADQSDSVQVARQMLEQLDAGTKGIETNKPSFTLVLDDQIAGISVGNADYSPNGDRIVFRAQDRAKLFVIDRSTTKIRSLLDDLGHWESVGLPSWSPDGRMIAYTLSRGLPSESKAEAVWAIFVLDPDGGTPRQIGPDVRQRIMGGINWSPDCQHLTYVTLEGDHTITLDGNEVEFRKKEDWADTGRIGGAHNLPTNRWVVNYRRKENEPGGDLFIYPVEGGPGRRLVSLPGVNNWQAWAPDGRTLYFVSGSTGSRNIWKLPMDPESGQATGEPQQVTFFKDTDIRNTKVLGNGDQIAFQMRTSKTSIMVADASSPNESYSVVRSGPYSPVLAPDGQTIYYVNDANDDRGIFAVSRQGGVPRRLTEMIPGQWSHPWLPRFDISPDGQTLAFSSRIDDGYCLFTIPTKGGATSLLANVPVEEFTRFNSIIPQYSPDGSKLAYASGDSLYVIPAEGGRPLKLAHLEGEWSMDSVRWSPDGKNIAAIGYNESENSVYVIPASGGDLQKLATYGSWLEGLDWHPDGERLTYHLSRYKSETHQAFLDGRPSALLFVAPGFWNYIGKWGPEETHFYFMGSVGNSWGIYVYDEASGETKLVSTHSKNRSVPVWSGDGKTMAWLETRSTDDQFWIMENF